MGAFEDDSASVTLYIPGLMVSLSLQATILSIKLSELVESIKSETIFPFTIRPTTEEFKQ